MIRRALKWFFFVLGFVVAYVILFVLSDFPGALTRMGPYSGQVVDSESGHPVADAYVFFTWDGDGLGGSAGCISSQVLRTNAEGRYTSEWRGYRFFLALGLTRIVPANVSAVALNYQPWGLSKDGPAYPNDYTFVPPNGWPWVTRQVGTIKLSALRHTAYSEDDWYRLSNCVGAHGQEEALIGYLRQRAAWWSAYCGPRSTPPTALDIQHFGEGFPDDTIVAAIDDRHRLPTGIQTIKELRNRLATLAGYTPEMKEQPNTAPSLTSEQWTAACELADVRMPIFENIER